MTTLAITKPYGTYQQFQYQTADLTPIKTLAVNLLKILAVMLIALALVGVAMAVFNVIVVAANIVGAWLLVHGWQVGLTMAIFYGAWRVKP